MQTLAANRYLMVLGLERWLAGGNQVRWVIALNVESTGPTKVHRFIFHFLSMKLVQVLHCEPASCWLQNHAPHRAPSQNNSHSQKFKMRQSRSCPEKRDQGSSTRNLSTKTIQTEQEHQGSRVIFTASYLLWWSNRLKKCMKHVRLKTQNHVAKV